MTEHEKDRAVIAEVVTGNGVRWASNILVELLGNYGEWLAPEKYEQLKSAVGVLAEFMCPHKAKDDDDE